MPALKYRWKELGLVSIQTFSGIITFIQFALIPLDISKINQQTGQNKIKEFITNNFDSFIDIFSSPFDFSEQFKKISAPIRVLLSSTVVFVAISLLYCIFFQPSWYFILLFLDLIIPCSFSFGILLFTKKYEGQQKVAIALIIIGSIYLFIRLFFFIFHIIKYKNWHKKSASLITNIFFARLQKNHDEKELNSITEDVHKQISRQEHSIQFDEINFSKRKRIIDFIISFIIWLTLFIFTVVNWKRILKKSFSGKQLEDASLIFNIITYILLSCLSLRLIINVFWIFFPKYDFLFITLKGIAFKGMFFLAGIALLPLIKIALRSTATQEFYCGWYQYYDPRSNTDSFLQYLMEREGDICVNCTKTSANSVEPCNQICYFDPKINPISLNVVIDSKYINDGEMVVIFLSPVCILLAFFVFLFINILRFIFKNSYDILRLLPAPTKNIECKFQTLLNTLKTAGLNVYRSYRYESAFYYFSFTESKLLICSWCSLMIYQISFFLNLLSQPVVPWIFSASSFFISLSHIFSTPFVSPLHNIVNIAAYFVSGISSFIIGFHTCKIIEMPPILGDFLVVIIIITPILTALITPFFIKKDPLLLSTEFDLVKLQRWNKKIDKIIQFRVKKEKALKKRKERKHDDNKSNDEDSLDEDDLVVFDEEPSVSVKENANERERIHDTIIGQFDLVRLSPIMIQEGIQYKARDKDGNVKKDYYDYKEKVDLIYPKKDIFEDNFDDATNEMLDSSNKLIDCVSYNGVLKFFHFTILVSSACLGWGVCSAIIHWKQNILGPNGNLFYCQCNMFPNGTYPAFGTY